MTKPLNDIPDYDVNPFVSLADLLRSSSNKSEDKRVASVATLATAIESFGIYTWDKYGRYMKFEKGSGEAEQALNLLAKVYEFEMDREPRDVGHPLEDAGYDPFNLYSGFGWATKVLPDFVSIMNRQSEISLDIKPVRDREKSSYLRIIAALLEYISGKTPGIPRHPSFTSETDLIDFLDEMYDGYEGLSQSNLSRKFPLAKGILKPKVPQVD
jgi:hypothetical protein